MVSRSKNVSKPLNTTTAELDRAGTATSRASKHYKRRRKRSKTFGNNQIAHKKPLRLGSLRRGGSWNTPRRPCKNKSAKLDKGLDFPYESCLVFILFGDFPMNFQMFLKCSKFFYFCYIVFPDIFSSLFFRNKGLKLKFAHWGFGS